MNSVSSQFNGFILFKGDKAYFRRDVFGSTEIGRLRVNRELLTDFIKNSNSSQKVKMTKNGMRVLDEVLYKRLLIYATTLACMRKRSTLRILRTAEVISKLDEYSLHFWYTEVISRFKERGVRALWRVSRSLRVLYGVDR